MSGIFISYSRQDEAWMNRFAKHLKPFTSLEGFDVFSDTVISVGQAFREEILLAIDTAQVAVLLVSADFLSSDFIREVELPRIQARYRAGELQIVPVLVQDCAWDHIPWLKDLQMRPWNAVPLATLRHARSEAELAKIVREILTL